MSDRYLKCVGGERERERERERENSLFLVKWRWRESKILYSTWKLSYTIVSRYIIIYKIYNDIVSSKCNWVNFRGVVANVLDCGIISEFELQSLYYLHFWSSPLGNGVNPLITPPSYHHSIRMALVLNNPRRFICKRTNKPNQVKCIWIQTGFFFYP